MTKRALLLATAGIWIGAAALTMQSGCRPEDRTGASLAIESFLVEIKAATDPDVRVQIGHRLRAFIRNQDRADIDRIDARAIDGIVELLGDRAEYLRAWAAMELGEIGPPARQAIPALENALRNADGIVITPVGGKIGTPESSAGAIIWALARIRKPSAAPDPKN